MGLKSSLLDWKERSGAVETVCSTATVQLESGPCLLIGVSVCGAAGGVGTASLSDGLAANAVKRFDFSTLASTTHAQEFHPPIKFRQGLYLVIGSNVTSVTVRYVPIKD